MLRTRIKTQLFTFSIEKIIICTVPVRIERIEDADDEFNDEEL